MKPLNGHYAVRIGRKPGIYSTWPECEAETKGFPGSVNFIEKLKSISLYIYTPSLYIYTPLQIFKKFKTLVDAKQFLNPNSSTGCTLPEALTSANTFSNLGKRKLIKDHVQVSVANRHNTNASDEYLSLINNSCETKVPSCHCNLICVQNVVRKESPNLGRKFFACPKNRGETCSFFSFADGHPSNKVLTLTFYITFIIFTQFPTRTRCHHM